MDIANDLIKAFNDGYAKGKAEALELIDIAGTMPPERNKGKWTDPEDLIWYKCTACGMYANQRYGLDEPIFWDYCPNCGAEMRQKNV